MASVTQPRNAALKPTKAEWAAGPHAATLATIEALALATPGTTAAAQVRCQGRTRILCGTMLQKAVVRLIAAGLTLCASL